VLRGKVDPTLSPDAKPPPVVDETPVRELADVTRGLPLSEATAEQVQALADSDRTPFALGQAVRTLLDGEGAPKGLVLEATRRATRWAKKKRADAPRTPRPAVGVAADLRKSPGGRLIMHSDLGDSSPVLGPPPTRNRATHPFVGTIEFHGLPTIRVETPKGGTRSGTDADGKSWSVTMPAHYGEFARTEGADGDPVDVFVGPNRHAPKAYVVHLQNPATGEHDEDKVFVGFDNADAARGCFSAAYNRDDLQMGAMRTLTTSELAEWLAARENRGAKLDAGRELHKAGAGQGDCVLHKGKHFKDEDKAQAAHKRVVEQYGLTEKDGDRYWRLKSHIYEQMGGSFEKSDLPASETVGTPAENRKPAAAASPPAPPPVARPHHHAEAMQLPTKPTKPTKRFPPPSHPKPTKTPRKLMETPPEMTKAQQRAMVDELLKAAGHKYIRRTPKPGGGYRYFYAESAAARGPAAGESVRLGEHVAHIGEVTATHVTVDGERLTHGQWLDKLSAHYAHFERDAAARAGLYARAVLRHVPAGALEQRDAAAVHAHIAPALARTGMTADAAQRAVEWALNRKGWSSDASAALLGEMTIGQRAKWVQENYQRVGAAAEDKRGADKSKPVRAVHVAQAVDALAPKAPAAARPHAELLAEALGAEFPGMRMEDLVHAIRTVQAHEKATKAPPKSDGAATSVYLPGEGGRPEKLAARFKLVEARDLVASHDASTFAPRKDYPQGLQERAYHRDKAEQAKVIRNAAGLIPEYVANTNPDAVNGTPLVDERGVVLGGNSRTMSMQRAYREDGGARLKAHLADNAAQFGLARKDMEAMEHPVLVRVVDTTARDPKLLVRQMNESMTQEMDPRVMQVAMGRKLDDDAVGKLAESMGTDQTLSEFLDSPASESFITALRRVGIIDARSQTRYMRDGKLNADGKQLVERVLVGKVVGDPDLLSDTNPSVVTALAQAIPYMVQAEAHGDGFNLRNDLREALTAHNDMQRRGLAPKSAKDATRSVREYTRQDTMFGGGDDALSHAANALATNERAQVLASVLFAKTGPRQLSSVFRAYADGARHNPEGQFSMFGPAKTPAAILAESVDMAKSLTKSQRNAADDLMHAAGLSHEVEIPDWLAWGIQAQEALTKGAGHKYIRRVPRPGGGYRYFYRVSGGKGGVGHESEFDVGAAFRVKDAGREGHFHVTGKAADGTLTIRHDETGATHTLSASALSSMLRTEHAEAIGAHREKLAQDIKDAKAAGASPKQVARLEAEATKHGVKPEPPPESSQTAAATPSPEDLRLIDIAKEYHDAAKDESRARRRFEDAAAGRRGKWWDEARALIAKGGTAEHRDAMDMRSKRKERTSSTDEGQARDDANRALASAARAQHWQGYIVSSKIHPRDFDRFSDLTGQLERGAMPVLAPQARVVMTEPTPSRPSRAIFVRAESPPPKPVELQSSHKQGVRFTMHKSASFAQRHEADALLKAAGVEPKKPAPKSRDQQRVVKATKDVGKVHERMQKIHAKAANEAANRGDGELSKLHADAAKAHEHAGIAHAAGDLDGKATKNAKDLSDVAKAATQATLDKHGAIATTSEAAKEGASAPKAKPAAAAPASGVGGRSKEGLKVIAIGPKGGKIVGYTTKDGKQKPIYEGSKAAAKLAATVEQHAPDPDPAAEAPAADAKPADVAPPEVDQNPTQEPALGPPDADATGGPPKDGVAQAAGGDAAPPAPPTAPSEPLDDKPLAPESQAGGEPADAPAPEDLGSASPKTDSPESRHAEEIAKMKGQVEEAHRKLEALAAHIDKNLVPMFNNLKGQARATHRNPSPSAVGWLVAQIGRFVSFVLGLNEDRSKALSATDAIKGEGAEPPAETPTKGEPKKPVKRPKMKSGKQASAYMQKSLTAPGAESACVRVLVTLQAIERHHHAAHLQASGEDSYGDHLLFQRIYSDVQHEIDGLSEKMVAAFGKACVDADARAADAASLLAEWSESDDTLERALDAEIQLQGTIEDALAEDVSPGLENFLQGLADSHEAAIYLLQQRIQPPELVRSMQRSAADELLKAARALG